MVERDTDFLNRLSSFLCGVKTRNNALCCGFRLALNPEETLLDLNGLRNYKEKDEVLDPESFAKKIMEQAIEESNYHQLLQKILVDFSVGFASLQATINTQLKEAGMSLKRLVEKEQRDSDVCLKFIAEFFKKSPSKNEESIGQIEQIASDIRRTLDIKATQKTVFSREMTEGVVDLVSQLSDNISATLDGFRNAMKLKTGVQKEEPEPVEDFPEKLQKEEEIELNLSKFLHEKTSIVPEMTKKNSICFGIGGIPRGNKNEFGVLACDGSFSLHCGMDFKKIAEGKADVLGGMACNSSMCFSPDATMFLVSIAADKRLFVFDSQSLKVRKIWTRPESSGILKAKWVDTHRVVGAFGKPGEIVLFSIDSELPTSVICPSETRDSLINDIDLKAGGSVVVGCTNTKNAVFALSIESQSIEWTHYHHKDCVNAVKFSNSEKYVISGSDDKRTILADARDGNFLSELDGFSARVRGVVWLPGDQYILGFSRKEVVLIWVNSTKCLHLLSKTTKESLDGSNIHSVNHCTWKEKEQLLGHCFALLGTYKGNMFKVPLE